MFFFIQTKTPQTLIDHIIWLYIFVTEDAACDVMKAAQRLPSPLTAI